MSKWTVPEEAVPVVAQEFKVEKRCQLYVNVPGAHTRLRPGASNDRVEVTVAVSNCPPDEAQVVLERMRLSTRQVKDTVRVQTDRQQQQTDARWWAWVRQKKAVVHLDIRLPAHADADVCTPGGSIDAADIDGTLVLELSGGDLRAEGLQGQLEIQAYGTDVDLEWFSGKKLVIVAASGSLRMRKIDADTLTVNASGAPVSMERIKGSTELVVHGAEATVRDVRGPFSAHVEGGPLHLDAAPDDRTDLTTVGGSVDAALPSSLSADVRFEGDAVTLDDAFVFDGDRETRRVEGTLNDGGPPLRLRAVRGSVRCTQR